MSGSSIRGITVEIGASTQGLSKALSDVSKKSRDIAGELKKVQKGLQLDPKNATLLAQKQALLAEAIENSKEKLNRLKEAEQQVRNQFARGEISQGQMRAFEREVIAAEQQLQRFETQLKQAGSTALRTGVDFEKLQGTLRGMGNKLKGIGTTMSAAFTAPIVGGFFAITQGTKELRGDLATLETNAKTAGQSMGVLNDAMVKMQAVTGETDANVEGLSNLLAAGFRNEKLTELVDSLAGASIKFKDTMKFEGIADGLQETLATGAAIGPFAELLERSGINLDDFNAGLKEAIANGDQENYVLETLAKTGLAETYEAYRKNNEEMVKAEEANFRMQQAFAKLGGTLSPILTPIIDGVTNLVNKFNDMDPATKKVILVIAGVVAAIGPLLVIIGQLALGVSGIIGLFGGGGLAAAFAAITGPVGIAVAAIAGLVAVLVYLWKNNEEFREKVIEIWENVKEAVEAIFGALKDFWKRWGDDIKALFELAMDNLGQIITLFLNVVTGDWKGAWENIKNIFANIWSAINIATRGAISNLASTVRGKLEDLWTYIKGIPSKALQWGKDIIRGLINGIKSLRIPMPHFDFSVNYKSIAGIKFPVPDFDVDWYKTGGIFTSPTLAGIGDVPEAVMPLEKLPQLMADALELASQKFNGPSTQLATAGGGDITIQNMYVRNDQDIKLIARELHGLLQSRSRAQGVIG